MNAWTNETNIDLRWWVVQRVQEKCSSLFTRFLILWRFEPIAPKETASAYAGHYSLFLCHFRIFTFILSLSLLIICSLVIWFYFKEWKSGWSSWSGVALILALPRASKIDLKLLLSFIFARMYIIMVPKVLLARSLCLNTVLLFFQ